LYVSVADFPSFTQNFTLTHCSTLTQHDSEGEQEHDPLQAKVIAKLFAAWPWNFSCEWSRAQANTTHCSRLPSLQGSGKKLSLVIL